MVIFPFRPNYYGITEANGQEVPEDKAALIVAKNRHGSIGDIPFYHNKSMTDFSDEPFGSERFDVLPDNRFVF